MTKCDWTAWIGGSRVGAGKGRSSMRRTIALLVFVAGCSRALPTPGGTSAPQGLTVHEWGTYTSVQGSNGATLDGMQHEEESLPSFVQQRSAAPGSGEKGIEALPQAVNQKLETPVLYFYGAYGHVKASVDFPGGIISQWFPAASTYAPA